MTPTLSRACLLAAALGMLGCGGSDNNGGSGPTGPVPGPLRVVLTSPNSDDGAVMFQVTGVIDSAVAPAGITIYQSTPGPNVIRVISTGGSITSGSNLLTIYVADVNKPTSVTLQLLQVAAKTTYAARAVGAYSLAAQK